MATKNVRHPHAYTLDLMRLAIDQLPPTFGEAKKKRYLERLNFFERNPQADYEEIQRAIGTLGRESWPYRKAYEDMYARYGRSSEESYLLQNLDQGIREKYERFVHEGGKLNYLETPRSLDEIRQGSPFERYFTPEEKYAIQQALLDARESARKEIDGLVLGKKRDEYETLFNEYAGRQLTLESGLDKLRDLAHVSKKWEPLILDKVRSFEEGWSVVEQGVSESELEHEVEYWQGTLESFLHA